MDLTDEQEKCKKKILEKILDKPYVYSCSKYSPFIFRITGYAGTGKTFLISQIRKAISSVNFRVAFVTLTGKAASVLRVTLNSHNALFEEDFVGTIHSLIYKPAFKYSNELNKKIIVGWRRRYNNELDSDIIFIDESSMVSKDIWQDLKSYNRTIIAFGDDGQLPPIDDSHSLLKNPDFHLTEIQRQANNSPIIKLAHYVRNGGIIPVNKMYSKDVFKLNWNDPECKRVFNNIIMDENTIILCGFNTSRVVLNKMIRDKMGFKNTEPYPNERIICLKNNHKTKLMNGQIGTMLWYMPESKNMFRLTIDVDGDVYECITTNNQFGKTNYNLFEKSKENTKMLRYANKKGYDLDYFDYGYAISVHKSQGSEWEKVILFEQRSSYWDDELYKKWLYTAITRARKKLFIINNFY